MQNKEIQDLQDKLQNYSLHWLPVEQFYYREFSITPFMDWQDLLLDTTFDEFFVAVARNGGPIALFMKRLTITANRNFRGKIFMFTQRGGRFKEIDLVNHSNKNLADLKEKMAFFAFSYEDDIVCLSEDRRLFIIDPFSNQTTERHLTDISSTQQVKDARLQKGVLAIRCEDTQGVSWFYWLNDIYHDCEVRQFSINQGENYEVKDFLIITKSERPELVYPMMKGGIYISQGSDSCIKKFHRFSLSGRGAEVNIESIGRVQYMALSPGGKYIAIYTRDMLRGNSLIIWKSDHRDEFNVETPIDDPEELNQLVWCGEDVVLLSYTKTILMVTPNGPMVVKEAIKPGLFCFPEVDGVRIFTHQECSFFENVQTPLVAALTIASIEPSAALIDAFRSFKNREPSADQDITKIEGDLHRAVIELVKAAGQVFEPEVRNFLLQAAAFGKKFVAHFDVFNADEYMRTVHFIRVLYSIRENRKIPLMMTYRELEKLKPKGLVKKLMKYNQHYLASQISKYMRLSMQKVVEDWACRVLKQSLNEDEHDLQKRMIKKLSKYDKINYIKITEQALEVSRRDLASALIEKEKSYVKKIPAILKMNEPKRAFQIACESGDPNYINLVITSIHAKGDKNAEQLLDYLLYLCGTNVKYQRHIVQYVRQLRNKNLTQLLINKPGAFSYDKFPQDVLIMTLEMRPNQEELYRAPQKFMRYINPESSAHPLIGEYLEVAKQLDIKTISSNPNQRGKIPSHCYQIPYPQSTVPVDTVNEAIYHKMWKMDSIDSFKAPGKLPEKRIDLLKAKFLIESNNLEKLRVTVLDKKNKIKSKAKAGIKEIVEMLLERERKDAMSQELIRDLVMNISNQDERLKLFLMAELYIDAMDVAIDLRSQEYQNEIMQKAPERIRSELMDMLQSGMPKRKK